MKVVQINSVCGSGSTGKICTGISEQMTADGIENYIIYSSGNCDYPNAIKCTERFPKLQALKSRIKGNYGFNSKKTTKAIIDNLKRIRTDIVHLHNLHSHNCNLDILFDYLRTNNIKVVWTFHDCWAFTAYCPHFMMAKCDKWKNECHNCPQYKKYSWIKDRSRWLYNKKKNAVCAIDLTVVTPSKWLADCVKESFMGDYPIKIINNGIDISVFTSTKNDFRQKNGISEDKFVLLGVAYKWVKSKGPDVFIRLAEKLDPDKFQIVMVGTDDDLDKQLPENIISIHRTANQKELAEIYSAADLFVNPTREDTYPTVNLEAISCGTPVLTYRTGGSTEMLDEQTGRIVECDDEEALYNAIIDIEQSRPFSSEVCREKAMSFSSKEKYKEYVSLYGELLK